MALAATSPTRIPKIALEECFVWEGQQEDVVEKIPLEYVINTGGGHDKYNRLLDIAGGRREAEMRENGVAIQVLSPTAPGLESLRDRTVAGQVRKAREVNDYIIGKIRGNKSFRAFASLPTRDPAAAAAELERGVRLGMVGALVNGEDTFYGEDGKSPETFLFYDTPDYDVLWQKFVDLDVPLYLHPAVYVSAGSIFDESLLSFYKQYPELVGSAWGFTVNIAQHVLRLVISGVFDRFPKLKLIIGHMGEILPWFAERFDHRMEMYRHDLAAIDPRDFKKNQLLSFRQPRRTLLEYFQRNIYLTTSGWFSDSALEYVIARIGVGRVMFAIDYPYESQKAAADWLEASPLSDSDKKKIAYGNAAKLLKLSNF